MSFRGTLLVILSVLGCLSRIAMAANRIHYTVSLVNPEQHLAQVTIEIPPGKNDRELQLPVWNALYQIRDFSQYINWIRIEEPAGAQLLQVNKSRWKISHAENGARVRYEVFANNPGPYGAQLDSHHAFLNLAEVLCYIEDERASPIELEVNSIPAGWKIATPLRQQGNSFSAVNYDQLVDSPMEISAFSEQDFHTNCGGYRVVVDSDGAQEILDKIVPLVRRIVSTETAWMADCPFQTYTFIYHFSDLPGDGGMEHAYSTAITLPREDLTKNFDRFANITAHEFFHLWNVKRIRPQSLEPIDYTKENYTPALWFSEGVDSTVAEYMLLRAGVLDERHYLDHFGEEITEFEMRPAHLTQSAEQSSIDAWLEKYPYYNLPVRDISYYNKGELLGVLLDLRMREATGDGTSLQDVFRLMNERYAKLGKFFADSAGVRESAEALTHADFGNFFQSYVSGVDEIPWDSFLSRVGLRLSTSEVTFADPGFQAERNFDQPPVVVQVTSGSGAEQAGLQAGDVILQANGHQAGRDFERVLGEMLPGTVMHVRVAREGAEHDLQWTTGSRKQKVFRLEDLPHVTAEQRSRRAAWLFGNAAPRK